jgi:hypothetical protein
MIPSSSIAFNEGGTAWWVVHGPADYHDHDGALDRPCDTCDGKGQTAEHWFACPDCDGTGRHTFTIEVEHVEQFMNGSWINTTRTLRVSVSPGMVLPIMRHPLESNGDTRYIVMDRHGDFYLFDHDCPTTEWPTVLDPFPPHAKPGMWAVLLDVHQNGENPQ